MIHVFRQINPKALLSVTKAVWIERKLCGTIELRNLKIAFLFVHIWLPKNLWENGKLMVFIKIYWSNWLFPFKILQILLESKCRKMPQKLLTNLLTKHIKSSSFSILLFANKHYLIISLVFLLLFILAYFSIAVTSKYLEFSFLLLCIKIILAGLYSTYQKLMWWFFFQSNFPACQFVVRIQFWCCGLLINCCSIWLAPFEWLICPFIRIQINI